MKIAIIGVGAVGQASASAIVYSGLASKLLLCDIEPNCAKAAMWDLQDALASVLRPCQIECASYEECAKCDVIVLSFTAGIASSRPDELARNLIELEKMREHLRGFGGIMLIATNPNDAIVFHARRLFEMDASRVFGTGTSLDSARLVGRISRDLGLKITDVSAWMLGEHGDSQLACLSAARARGVDIKTAYERANVQLDAEQIESFVAYRGHDVYKLKGKTEYGIAAAVLRILKAIAHNEEALICVSACQQVSWCEQNEKYILQARLDNGSKQAFSRPTIIGSRGIHALVDIALNASEKAKLTKSIEFIKSMCE